MPFNPTARRCLLLTVISFCCFAMASTVTGQDTVTGAFQGNVTNSQTGTPIEGATVEIINLAGGTPSVRRTNSKGDYYQGQLAPGLYTIRVSMQGYQTKELTQRLFVSRTGDVVPVPVALDPVGVAPTAVVAVPAVAEESDTAVNTKDARRDGSYPDKEAPTLPLGSTTQVRTFDELSLLLPGVAPPPQTIGNGSGPGVGAGVGSAGQFAVNGLRSRGNNFTVDGSDNNDEDIGVRRQGFMALIPQPIESVKEYQAITLLAPAQFGRNLGAQVNAVSKSGGNDLHGTIYGFLNSSQLNSRNFFDTTNGTNLIPLRANNLPVLLVVDTPVGFDVLELSARNQSNGEDSFTLGQGGFALGGRLKRDHTFFFVSAEGQFQNAVKEVSFAVPTLPQRGMFGTGVTGLFRDPFTGAAISTPPTNSEGDIIFSFFPFPNNPTGVYGANTFTQVLPASGRGRVASGKLDHNFKFNERQQSATGRYNFTDDWRDLPATGGAIHATLRSRVRTQNFSFFLNSEVSGAESTRQAFNQVRLSYGRTRLNFSEAGNQQESLLRSRLFPATPFLLNVPVLSNITEPDAPGVPNSTFAGFFATGLETETFILGPVGQVNIAGFSPIGVDVYSFPQRRVNNTYQVADTFTLRSGDHSFTFGADLRRSELNSELPRNSLPQITFNGAPQFTFDAATGTFGLDPARRFIRPEDLAAGGASSGFFLTLNTPGTSNAIGLRYYQLNFFGQDEWRVRDNLAISYGLRYEYNTPPRSAHGLIERTFNAPELNLVPGLNTFIAGRTRIFDPDKNNFSPRVSIAYTPDLFGSEKTSVIRVGYGLFYDQILGAVASQSRNVFPSFLTTNFAGGLANFFFGSGIGGAELGFASPAHPAFIDLLQAGSLNTLNLGDLRTLADDIDLFNRAVNGPFVPVNSTIGITLPARNLPMPMAHHYSATFEQQLNPSLVFSAAYVGTSGRKLLRLTTPNLGPNFIPAPVGLQTSFIASFIGVALPPGSRLSPQGRFVGGRPVSTVGAVNIYETTASSRYDSLQLQARGRFRTRLQFQAAYTLSKVTDDVSDVFDLAGASALPQNSLTFAGESGPANFDARHRFSYNMIYDFSSFDDRGRAFRFFFGGLQIASIGRIQTGQPFTVNSIFDVNMDGNLTDRLDNTNGLEVTGDRRQPLRLTTANTFSLLAPVGQDGSLGRNTFRAGNVIELDVSVIKNFVISGQRALTLRMDIFNFINRANFGVPVRFLEAPGFGQATETVTPGRRLQFALKFSF